MNLPHPTTLMIDCMERYLDRLTKSLREVAARDDDDVLFLRLANQSYRRGYYRGQAHAITEVRHIIAGVRNNADPSNRTLMWVDRRIAGTDGHVSLSNFVFTRLGAEMTGPCFDLDRINESVLPTGVPDDPGKVGEKAGIAEVMWGLSEQMAVAMAVAGGPQDPRSTNEIATDFREHLTFQVGPTPAETGGTAATHDG